MYFRKLLHITCIVCLLSIFVWSHTAHAYPNANDKDWQTAEKKLDTAYKAMKQWETQLADVRDAAQTLSDAWDKNREKIRTGTATTVTNAAAAVIGIVTAYFTAGTLTVAYLPSIFQGWLATKAGLETGSESVKSTAYLQVLITAISALDTVLADVDTAYATYTDCYDVYLTIISGHDGGLVRFNGNIMSSVYTKEQVYAAVNPRNSLGIGIK